ncbi:MAG: response regulator [Verrucomicrobiota bacterium]|nr:response regulator [Verrucomicrobiota bacterium]
MSSRVLVVDDEVDIQDLVKFNLQAEGYDVIQALTAEDAIRLSSEGKPDLIILDLMLPDLDGISVCEIIKRNEVTSQTPILMLTAWSSMQSRVLGIEAGADDYMSKPFSPKELSMRVQRILAQQAR